VQARAVPSRLHVSAADVFGAAGGTQAALPEDARLVSRPRSLQVMGQLQLPAGAEPRRVLVVLSCRAYAAIQDYAPAMPVHTRDLQVRLLWTSAPCVRISRGAKWQQLSPARRAPT
jgi:hypothetical protein